MKIVYVLKKGFQYFPPCLTQVLCLDDLGVELEVYHGKNTETIDNLLDKRGIKHFELSSDRQSKNKFERAINLLRFIPEMKKLNRAIPKDTLLWLGNCETAVAFGIKKLKNRRFVVSVLELYEEKSFLGKTLAKYINYAEAVVCCEPHRAAIMMSRHNLKKKPFVVANKPYEYQETIKAKEEILQKLDDYKDKFIVIYQGNISPERPLMRIAKALNKLGDPNVYFFVLGKFFSGGKMDYINEVKKAYPNTVFWGYVPAPEHLAITAKCNIGIATYDMHCMNTVFCAPNKIYEYSKYGLPMLTSLNIGLTETVGVAKAAECVNFDDEEEILKGIKTIKDNYSFYSENALKFYNDYDVKERIAEVLSGLKEGRE